MKVLKLVKAFSLLLLNFAALSIFSSLYFAFTFFVASAIIWFFLLILSNCSCSSFFDLLIFFFDELKCACVCLLQYDACFPHPLRSQIASDNMKNLGEFFGQLHLVKPWVYQCSETSTAKEIESVYKTALDLYRKHQSVNIVNERCIVYLDEASLPKEKRSALKVTHYYLDRSFGSDRPHVGTVMLTNLTLDAAKTNRAVQVLQSEVRMLC